MPGLHCWNHQDSEAGVGVEGGEPGSGGTPWGYCRPYNNNLCPARPGPALGDAAAPRVTLER